MFNLGIGSWCYADVIAKTVTHLALSDEMNTQDQFPFAAGPTLESDPLFFSYVGPVFGTPAQNENNFVSVSRKVGQLRYPAPHYRKRYKKYNVWSNVAMPTAEL